MKMTSNIFVDNFSLQKSHLDNMFGRVGVVDIEKSQGNRTNHPSFKHFSALLSDVEKWAKNTHNEEQFLKNVNGDIQKRTSHEKVKLSKLDLSSKQLESLRSKWKEIRFKGKNNS